MAEHRWTSSIAASWAATGSWHDATVPVTGDTTLFGEFGTGSVTGGLDQSAIDLAAIKILRRYPGDIATSGSPLRIAAGKIVHQGSGAIHIKGEHASGKLDIVVFDVDQRAGITTQSTLDGNIIRLLGNSGNVLVKASATTMTLLQSLGHRMLFTLADTGTALNNCHINGGTVVCNRPINGPMSLNGGILTLTRDMNASFKGVIYGGTMEFSPTNALLAANGSLTVLNGVFDLSGLARQKTMGTLIYGTGATIIDPNNSVGPILDLRAELA